MILSEEQAIRNTRNKKFKVPTEALARSLEDYLHNNVFAHQHCN